MYPFGRLLGISIKAAFSKPLDVGEISTTTFRCVPWDLDMFMEMNNGRVLTLYDLGRFNLAIRTGLAKVLKRNRWGLVVAGGTVRYRRRIKVFDRVTMRTQVAGMDDRWIYVAQSMWVKDQPCSSLLLRTGVTGNGKVVPTEAVREAMNLEGWVAEPSAWVKSWIDSEEDRPWPPEP